VKGGEKRGEGGDVLTRLRVEEVADHSVRDEVRRRSIGKGGGEVYAML